MNRFAMMMLVLVFLMGVTAPVLADDYNRTKDLQLMTGEKAREDALEPADNAEPLPAEPPEAPVVDVPLTGETVKLFCVIPKDHLGNLEAVCQKYGAKLSIYWNYRNLILMKRTACVVEAAKNNTHLLHTLYKKFNAKKMKKIQLTVSVWAYSAIHGVNLKREEFKLGTFDEMDAIMSQMLKKPYGPNAKIFHVIEKYFPGMVNSLCQVRKEYNVIGKEKKFLDNPTVTVELTGLNMNGQNKNVTMFKDMLLYKTIKRAKNFKWGK